MRTFIISIIGICSLASIGYLFFIPQHQAIDSSVQRLNIVCTTSLIADAVRHVGGACVNVYNLMGSGVDPHLYRAREQDLHYLAAANIIFYNGLHLEGKMADVFAHFASNKKTVAVTDALPKERLRVTDDTMTVYDPHVWHDVSLWMIIVAYIRDQLIVLDALHQELYTTQAQEYLDKLDQLHKSLQQQAQNIPESKRVLITAHDAFGYFGRAYGFVVVGLQGISTDAEIGIHDIHHLTDIIVQKQIPTIFVESSINARSMLALQQAVHARGHNVHIGQALFSDALGDADSQAHDYCSMMRYNMRVICHDLYDN